MIKGEQLTRLLNFSDAVVAVAITLLVIPLTDLFRSGSEQSIGHILGSYEFAATFSSFLISFFVIYSFWESHHRLFANVTEISDRVAKLNRLWLLSIILVPATTIINMSSQDNVGIYIYGGVLIINTLLLRIIKSRLTPSYKIFANSLMWALVLCLIVVTIFPQIGHGTFYLLLLSIPLKRYFPQVFTDW